MGFPAILVLPKPCHIKISYPLFLARILISIPSPVFGVMHIMGANNKAFMVSGWLSGGAIWINLTCLANILVGVAIAANKLMHLALGMPRHK